MAVEQGENDAIDFPLTRIIIPREINGEEGMALAINRRELERFGKFLVVGTFGAGVDFGFYNLLLNPAERWLTGKGAFVQALLSLGATSGQVGNLAPALAGSISFVLAIISNFIWNRYWTYPDSRSKPLLKQFAQFFLVNLTGIVIRVPIITLTHRPFARLVTELLPALSANAERLGKNLALALAVGIVLFWNFFVNRYWTYNDVE